MPIIQNQDGSIDLICKGVFEYGDIEGSGTHFGAKLLEYVGNDVPQTWAIIDRICIALLDECTYKISPDSPFTFDAKSVILDYRDDIWSILTRVVYKTPQEVIFPVTP